MKSDNRYDPENIKKTARNYSRLFFACWGGLFLLIVIKYLQGFNLNSTGWRRALQDVFIILIFFPGIGLFFGGISFAFTAIENVILLRKIRKGIDVESVSQRLDMIAMKGFARSLLIVIGGMVFSIWIGGVFGFICLLFVIWCACSICVESIQSVKESGRWKEIERRGEQSKFAPPINLD